ncbi:MAG: hypothetical protein ACE5GL_07500 [Calditrichia bacterium]
MPLSYQSGDDIYIRKWLISNNWGSAGHVSAEPWWISANRYANLTFWLEYDYRSHIVWAAQDDIRNPIVAYRNYKSETSPGEFTYFYSGSIPNATFPTIAVDNTYGRVTILFEEDGQIIKRQYSGKMWIEERCASGAFPNIIAHRREGGFLDNRNQPTLPHPA